MPQEDGQLPGEGQVPTTQPFRPRHECVLRGIVSKLKHVRAMISKTTAIVAKIPGIVAYNDLLERILERGVELDGESQLTAMGGGPANLSATSRLAPMLLSPGGGIRGISLRRKGAPVAGASIRPKT